MPTPTIEDFMTASPHTIGVDQPLHKAHGFMCQHRVRHLPVLDGGELVGVLSERDLSFVENLPDVDPSEVRVEEAMSSAVYAVPPDAALERVADEMAQHRYGSAVVMRAGKVVGIFTAVDACRALAAVMRASRV